MTYTHRKQLCQYTKKSTELDSQIAQMLKYIVEDGNKKIKYKK